MNKIILAPFKLIAMFGIIMIAVCTLPIYLLIGGNKINCAVNEWNEAFTHAFKKIKSW